MIHLCAGFDTRSPSFAVSVCGEDLRAGGTAVLDWLRSTCDACREGAPAPTDVHLCRSAAEQAAGEALCGAERTSWDEATIIEAHLTGERGPMWRSTLREDETTCQACAEMLDEAPLGLLDPTTTAGYEDTV